jgi:hypothetical protein
MSLPSVRGAWIVSGIHVQTFFLHNLSALVTVERFDISDSIFAVGFKIESHYVVQAGPGTHYVAQDGLKFMILLFWPPEC